MIHYPLNVVLHLTNSNLTEDGKPIIKIGDLIIFSEEPADSKGYIPYELFFKWIDMYFEYTDMEQKNIEQLKWYCPEFCVSNASAVFEVSERETFG